MDPLRDRVRAYVLREQGASAGADHDQSGEGELDITYLPEALAGQVRAFLSGWHPAAA